MQHVMTVELANGETTSMTMQEVSDYALSSLKDLTVMPEILKRGSAKRGSITFRI